LSVISVLLSPHRLRQGLVIVDAMGAIATVANTRRRNGSNDNLGSEESL
jgi:hypothetical protein